MQALAKQGLDAEENALAALAARPEAKEAPALWLALAQLYEEAGRADEALTAAANVLLHPAHDAHEAERAEAMAQRVLAAAAKPARVRWYLALAHAFPARAREAIGKAAALADAALWETLWADASIPRDVLLALGEALGRAYAMQGDRADLRRLTETVAALAPTSPLHAQLEAWLARAQAPQGAVALGLVLADPYADEEAFLQGAAKALEALGAPWGITIEHARDPYALRIALARLAAQDQAAIIALASPDFVAEILRDWRHPRPLWLVSPARAPKPLPNPSVFFDAAAPWTQAKQLAQLAQRLGATRMLVLGLDAYPFRDEAEAIAEAFQDLGGEVVELDLVPAEEKDIRGLLLAVRERTDDEATLFDLDLDAALFAPTQRLEPRLPPGFDAVYLAMPGELVYLVAPQLAWAGIRDVLLLGSSSWDDGHLLDDRGRYLTGAVFCSYGIWEAPQSAEDRRARLFAALGESAAQVLGALIARLGLADEALRDALAALEGVATASGVLRVHADHEIARTTPCFVVRHGRIVRFSAPDAPKAEGSLPDRYSPQAPRGRSAETPPPPSP